MDAMTTQFSLLALGRQSAARVPLCIRNGIFALGCWDTATAFDLLKSHSYDVFVCDLQLADMDAVAFVQAVREISPNTVVVFSIDPGDLRHTLLATNTGVSGYVVGCDSSQGFLRDIKAVQAKNTLISHLADAGRRCLTN
jgi:DNA-binding NarL/FixJ family response regulator